MAKTEHTIGKVNWLAEVTRRKHLTSDEAINEGILEFLKGTFPCVILNLNSQNIYEPSSALNDVIVKQVLRFFEGKTPERILELKKNIDE